MHSEIVKKLRSEFDGRPVSEQLEWEVQQRLDELSPSRKLYAIWKHGRPSAVTEDAAFAPQLSEDEEAEYG